MMFFLLALAVSVLGVIPLLVGRKPVPALLLGLASTVVLGTIFYLAVPSLAWPWWGMLGISVLPLWVTSSVTHSFLEDEFQPTLWFPLVLGGIMLLSTLRGCEIIMAPEYSALLGKVEERVWTKDVQPKDPKHMRMASAENATRLAMQALGQEGAIGSQFEILQSAITPQFIDGKFCLIAPIDFSGWLTWRATRNIPGYILVDGEDPRTPAKFVSLPKDQQFAYSPGAYWGHNLRRHLWNEGYRDVAFAAYLLEIDDDHKPWWVVTVYKPTIFASGEKMLGTVLVDPINGKHTFYSMGKIPQWVDVALPPSFAESYVDWRGLFNGGWWNSWTSRKNVTVGEKPLLVYGSDNEPYYAIGVTSTSKTDTSLIGLYYVHTRTGKATFYTAKGSTESAILQAVNKNEQVQFRHLHGTTPQIYNVYGTMACVVPLLNENHLFQGVAIVNVENVQVMGVGNDQFEALRAYQKALPVSGHQIAPELAYALQRVEGQIDRVVVLPQSGATTFYLHLEGIPHVFTAGLSLSPEKLPLTQAGDQVSVEYYASQEAVEPMHAFDNLSLQLEATAAETAVRAAGAQSRPE